MYTPHIIDEIMSRDLLETMIQRGYVRTQTHPFEPLTIYNYTEKAQFDQVWNDVTLQCRGLIINSTTQEIVARPFRKFFNYGQSHAPLIHLDARVRVQDKMDGSLGIMYREPSTRRWAIATRGSFTSHQSMWATNFLQTYYPNYDPGDDVTHLFEIIYPENRIVCDYGNTRGLYHLATIDVMTGHEIGTTLPFIIDWPGPRAETLGVMKFREALELTPRDGVEGVVITEVGSYREHLHKVKIKQDDYVALHRVITGLNSRVIWEHLKNGKPVDEIAELVPDEFHAWIQTTASLFTMHFHYFEALITDTYNNLIKSLPKEFTRKDFAQAVQSVVVPDIRWAMFSILDQRVISHKIWDMIRPTVITTPPGTLVADE